MNGNKAGIRGKLNNLYGKDVHTGRLIIAFLAVLIGMAILKPQKFFSYINFQTMAAQFPEFGLMSLGIMVCMISGGIDLSVVGAANLAAIASGIVLKSMVGTGGTLAWYGIPVTMTCGILIGVIAGIFNGILVAKIHIPPILATLGTNELYTGIAIILTEGKAVSNLPMDYSAVIAGKLFGIIPVQLIIFVIMAGIISFLLSSTTYGTRLYLLGTNARAAKFSGLNNGRLLIKTYALSGICASLGGLVMLANYNSARADYGTVYTLQCVLIVVLGGVNPDGGKGKISGVVFSILVLQMLSSGLNMFPQISNFYKALIWGSVLLIVMVLNYFSENKKGN
ncbi:MAG TPA: ABC transporter permease [Ruminiclostridium sp.]|nr:ABC transporter permease [Ruminiclostridium sp.]